MNSKGDIKPLGEFKEEFTKELIGRGLSEDDEKFTKVLQAKLDRLVEVPEGSLEKLKMLSRNERRLWFKEQKRKIP